MAQKASNPSDQSIQPRTCKVTPLASIPRSDNHCHSTRTKRLPSHALGAEVVRIRQAVPALRLLSARTAKVSNQRQRWPNATDPVQNTGKRNSKCTARLLASITAPASLVFCGSVISESSLTLYSVHTAYSRVSVTLWQVTVRAMCGLHSPRLQVAARRDRRLKHRQGSIANPIVKGNFFGK